MIEDRQIIRIQDADYGCEERPDDYVPMALLTMRNKQGEESLKEIAYRWLDELDIQEGDWVYFDKGIIFKLER